MSIVYCQVCTLPPEYCEFDRKKFSQCKNWLRSAHPDLFDELYNANDAKQQEQEPVAPPPAPEAEADGSATDEEFGDNANNEDDAPNADDAPPPPSRRDEEDDSDADTPPPVQPKKGKRRRRPRKKRSAPAEEAEDLAENSPKKKSKRKSPNKPPPQPSSRRRAVVDDDDEENDEDEEVKSNGPGSDEEPRNSRQVRFQEPPERPVRSRGKQNQKKYIGVSTATRRGNKKLTVVTGLMDFGMKPKKAQSAFRKRFASGVGVNEVNGKQEIVVQGEHRYEMMRFLSDKWKVPPKILFYKTRDGLVPAFSPEGMLMPPP